MNGRSLDEVLSTQGGRWPGGDSAHLFGGLLAGLAARLAASTVPPARALHSLHGHFVAAGDGRQPVGLTITPLRDGGRFSTRQVTASQGDGVLFTATASFHAPEPGPRYEVAATEVVPRPDALAAGRYDTAMFDSRDVPDTGSGTRWAWFHPREPVGDDPALHAAALVLLTDFGATRGVRQPHADHPELARRQSVSLDHTVWLHVPPRVDQWLLVGFRALATGAGRGVALGEVRAASGALVATVAQEALLRLPD